MRTFKNIAVLVHDARAEAKLSQAQLSHKLGYRNGQFISNVERGLCNVPLKKITALAKHISVEPKKIVAAMTIDFNETLVSFTGVK